MPSEKTVPTRCSLTALRLSALLLVLLQVCSSYNIDVASAQVISREVGQLFGYTVAVQKTSGKFTKRIIVGAPLGGADNQGLVYVCNFQTEFCTPIVIPASREDLVLSELQWLGGSLAVSRADNSPVFVCANRWTNKVMVTQTNSSDVHYLPQGRCFELDANLVPESTVYKPCSSGGISNMQLGYCQAGFSVALSRSGVKVLGLPGAWLHLGSLLSISAGKGRTLLPTLGSFVLSGTSYLGYSVDVGTLTSNSSVEGDFIGGAPVAGWSYGEVRVFYESNRSRVVVLKNPSEQIWSYFGHSVCAVDLNGDRLDEVVVGAPYQSKVGDEGAVYVFQNEEGDLKYKGLVILGDHQPWALFGFTVANIGDVDMDGFQDLAVGAPRAGQDGSGAVFIYHGSARDVLLIPYSQRILATDISSGNPPRSFGSSLYGNVDLDVNLYPDMVVGCPHSDKVVILKTRPIVDINGSLAVDQHMLYVPADFVCTSPDGGRFPCLNISICWQHQGLGAPMELSLKYTLFADSSVDLSHTLFFLGKENGRVSSVSDTVQLVLSVPTCVYHRVFFLDQSDRLTTLGSILFWAKFSVVPPSSCLAPQRVPCPILRNTSLSKFSAKVNFIKDCGLDFVCSSALKMEGHYVLSKGGSEFIKGSTESVAVVLEVANLREHAFSTVLSVVYPTVLRLVGVTSSARKLALEVSEIPTNDTAAGLFEVFLGNPFSANSSDTLTVKFDRRRTARVATNSLDIFASIKTVSEDDEEDNHVVLSIPVISDAEMNILSSVNPDMLNFFFNRSADSWKPGNYTTNFTFFIKNLGPGSVERGMVLIHMPMFAAGHKISTVVAHYSTSRTECQVDKNELQPSPNATTHAHDSGDALLATLNCSNSLCQNITCFFMQMDKGEAETIRVSVTWLSNGLGFLTKRKSAHILLSGDAELVVMENTALNQSVLMTISRKTQATLTMEFEVENLSQGYVNPLWYIASVLAGLLLIIILMVVLYKRGFFDKKFRPPRDDQAASLLVFSKSADDQVEPVRHD